MNPEPVLSELRIPRDYNAAALIDNNIAEGRGSKPAIREPGSTLTYADLAARMNRAGNALKTLGLQMEQRILLCLCDAADFPAFFWGAIKIGVVPVPVNTLLSSKEYDFLLRDSRARVLVVSSALLEKFEPILQGQPYLQTVIVSDRGCPKEVGSLHQHAESLLALASPELQAAPTSCDDVAFWLYSSGSTGAPKGAMHLHSHLIATARLYGQRVLGIRSDDVVFSAAKLFFAYGLGNAMSFPMAVGATTVLRPDRPTPDLIFDVMRRHRPTIFYAVPTLYAALLAHNAIGPGAGSDRLRRCVSAGEALPP